MQTKLLEIRDVGTFIPVMATRLSASSPEQMYLLRRAGYGPIQRLDPSADGQPPYHEIEPYIVLWPLVGGHCTYDPYDWPTRARTYPEAHRYIIQHWFELVNGDVVDVEFILGETKKPKVSEQYTHPALETG